MRTTTFSITFAAISMFSMAALAEPYIYVAAGSANKVLVIDAENNKVINEFNDISNPHSVVITPDNEYVIAGLRNMKYGNLDLA